MKWSHVIALALGWGLRGAVLTVLGVLPHDPTMLPTIVVLSVLWIADVAYHVGERHSKRHVL